MSAPKTQQHLPTGSDVDSACAPAKSQRCFSPCSHVCGRKVTQGLCSNVTSPGLSTLRSPCVGTQCSLAPRVQPWLPRPERALHAKRIKQIVSPNPQRCCYHPNNLLLGLMMFLNLFQGTGQDRRWCHRCRASPPLGDMSSFLLRSDMPLPKPSRIHQTNIAMHQPQLSLSFFQCSSKFRLAHGKEP